MTLESRKRESGLFLAKYTPTEEEIAEAEAAAKQFLDEPGRDV